MFFPSPELRLHSDEPHKDIFTPKAMRAHERPPEEKLKLYLQALGESGKVIYEWHLAQHRFQWNEQAAKVLPFVVDERLQSESYWLTLVHPDDRKILTDLRERIASVRHVDISYRLTPGDGKTYQVKQTGMVLQDANGQPQVIGILELVTAAQKAPALEMVSDLAITTSEAIEYDYPPVFLNKLKAAIALGRAGGPSGALYIIDINNLAMIINAYGHNASEVVMAQLTQEIRKSLSGEDAVERIHRDQLGVIIASCPKQEIAMIAGEIQQVVQTYGAKSAVGSLHVTCTIGSVDIPGTAESVTDAIDRAYIALSSTQGIAHRAFEETHEDSSAIRQQMGLANYLRKAIHENRLRLAYQPVIETKTGNIAHYEALLRLIGDDGKISSAGALIPIAERMGLIDLIDHLVLDMVVKELRASPNVTLAFNVSNLTTDNTSWLEHFTQYLKKHPDLAPRMIVEITETAAQRDLRRTAYFVASLQALGCRVALDDFGSGYTSFRQLKALSVDMVKIDGAFIKDLVDNADNRFFVKTLLDFTNGFGLEAVAEFVEKGETAKMLMELGVQFMQGYYFGKPENFRSWLNKGEYKKS